MEGAAGRAAADWLAAAATALARKIAEVRLECDGGGGGPGGR
jgi:hypothetical protein